MVDVVPTLTGDDGTRSNVSRRGLMGLSAAGALGAVLPFPAAAATTGHPTQMAVEFVYEAIVTLGPAEQVGDTPLGKRVRIPITGGRFAGPRLSGTILPEGMDWQLIRRDGVTMLEAAYLMRERDGTLIHITNRGVATKGYVRTTPVFDVPLGPHQWLNEAVFIGTVGPADKADGAAVRITVYRLA